MESVKPAESLLDENLSKATDSLYQQLIDNCWFDKHKFDELTASIFVLHGIVPDEHRRVVSIKLWELSYLIISALRCHYVPSDVYKIENIQDDEVRQIDTILYYISSWFAYNKKIDEQSLRFGSWS